DSDACCAARGRGPMKIPKEVTLAKKAANKNNSVNSTGPTSILGKFYSSQNALRHGLYARDILLPGESESEWQASRRNDECLLASWLPRDSSSQEPLLD